ncbi:uncharacterized protein LOC111104908 isoform X2 [Crassostrea virginica]
MMEEKTTKVTDVETIFQEMRKKEMEILLKAGFPDEYNGEAKSALEIFQENRQKEIEILVRAGFPNNVNKSESLSSISGTTLTQSISEYSTITELDTSFSSWNVEENQVLKDQLGEVDSLIGEADQEKRTNSFMQSLMCFTCCYKGSSPLANTKKQNGKCSKRRPGLVRRFRDFVLRTVFRRGRN